MRLILLRFFILSILIIACSKDKNVKVIDQLDDSEWIRDSYQFDNNHSFEDFSLKDKYIFNSNGTYQIEKYLLNYDTLTFVPYMETIFREGTWSFNESDMIIDFDRFSIFDCNMDSLNNIPFIVNDSIVLSCDGLFSDYKIIDYSENTLIVQPFINTNGCEYKELFRKIK